MKAGTKGELYASDVVFLLSSLSGEVLRSETGALSLPLNVNYPRY